MKIKQIARNNNLKQLGLLKRTASTGVKITLIIHVHVKRHHVHVYIYIITVALSTRHVYSFTCSCPSFFLPLSLSLSLSLLEEASCLPVALKGKSNNILREQVRTIYHAYCSWPLQKHFKLLISIKCSITGLGSSVIK